MRRARTLTAALAALMIVSPAVAAPGDSELTLGVGGLPAQTLFELVTDITTAALSFGTIEPATESDHPVVFLEYSRYRSERTRLIAHVNAVGFEKEYTLGDDGDVVGRISDDFFTAMGGVSHDWLVTGGFRAYVGFMLGVTMLRSGTDIDEVETESAAMAAWQITPLGLRIGNGFVVDLALGVGHKGLVTAGAGVRF